MSLYGRNRKIAKMTVNCHDKCNNLISEDFVHGESRYLKNNRCTVCGVYLSKKHYGIFCPCCNTVTRKSPRYVRNREVPRI
jgi:uncharacterized Zn finger protein (UPF0148 family)